MTRSSAFFCPRSTIFFSFLMILHRIRPSPFLVEGSMQQYSRNWPLLDTNAGSVVSTPISPSGPSHTWVSSCDGHLMQVNCLMIVTSAKIDVILIVRYVRLPLVLA